MSDVHDAAGSHGQPCRLEDMLLIRAFARLLPGGQKLLLPWLHLRTYAPDEMVYKQGEPAAAVFFLISGSLALHAETADGKYDRLKIVASGQACNAAALSSEAFNGESCRALESSRVVVLPQSAFMDLLARRPTVAAALLQGILDETLDDWRLALRAYSSLTDHLTRANIIV
jgi:CRP-like cAMP-binding protein